MSKHEDRRYDRQRENERWEERNERRRHADRPRRNPYSSEQRSRYQDDIWREGNPAWRNDAGPYQRMPHNSRRSYDERGYTNEFYPHEVYNDDFYQDEPYLGTKFSDRERRNSRYSNPDYRFPNDYQHTQYGSFGDARDERSGLTEGQREAYDEVLYSRGPYDPNVDGRSLGDRHHVPYGLSHRGKGPKYYIRQDVNIEEDVNHALMDSHSVDATDIEVMVQDGNVILSGMVDSRVERRDAETAIDYISGIRNIENRIHIRPYNEQKHHHENSSDKSKLKTESKDVTAKSRNGKAKA